MYEEFRDCWLESTRVTQIHSTPVEDAARASGLPERASPRAQSNARWSNGALCLILPWGKSIATPLPAAGLCLTGRNDEAFIVVSRRPDLAATPRATRTSMRDTGGKVKSASFGGGRDPSRFRKWGLVHGPRIMAPIKLHCRASSCDGESLRLPATMSLRCTRRCVCTGRRTFPAPPLPAQEGAAEGTTPPGLFLLLFFWLSKGGKARKGTEVGGT